MDWTAIGAIATAATGFIFLLSVILLAWQIRELRLATYAQAYTTILELIQNEETRKARHTLYKTLENPDKQNKPENWTTQERDAAEKVCHSFNSVAIMVRKGMLSKKIIVENWNFALVRSWEAASPLVHLYRKQRSYNLLWHNFEWLAQEAKRMGNKIAH